MKDKKGGLFSKIISVLKGNSNSGGKKPPLMLLIAAGAIILLLFMNSINPFVQPSSENNTSQSNINAEPAFLNKQDQTFSTEKYEKEYETKLKDVLEQIKGVSDVSVVVNVEGTEKKIVEKDSVSSHSNTRETDKEGGEREIEDQSIDQKAVIINGENGDEPLIISIEKPKIRGVLVVAKGAEMIAVKKELIEAVTRVLDVPSHRVSVQAKK